MMVVLAAGRPCVGLGLGAVSKTPMELQFELPGGSALAN